MHPEQLVLPAIATAALGTALLVPLRDDRRVKRATFSAIRRPLRADFAAVAREEEPLPVLTLEPNSDTEPLSSPTLEATPPVLGWTTRLGAPVTALRAWFERQPAFASGEHSRNENAQESVIERSFADTLSALLTAGDDIEVPLAELEKAPASPATLSLSKACPELVEGRSRDASFEGSRSADDVVGGPAPRAVVDRAVPLTRMPLRPQTDTFTWPRFISGRVLDSRSERHAFLRSALEEPREGLDDVLNAAYHEEDPAGRMLVLHALHRGGFRSAHNALINALNVGTDEERAFAVDALLESGACNDVTPAFSDRLEAIAARAALGYVGHAARSVYVAALDPFVDHARIDAILALLAGALE